MAINLLFGYLVPLGSIDQAKAEPERANNAGKTPTHLGMGFRGLGPTGVWVLGLQAPIGFWV